MSWLTNLKLKPKLLTAFGLCALITVVVAALGQSGIAELYEQIQDITGNSLISIKKTDTVKANLVGTNRDLYKAIVLTTSNAEQADKVRNGADEAVHAMGKSRTLAQSTQLLATEAGLALQRISEGVSQINERNMVIASAAEEQAQVAREVDRNLVNIQDLSTQTAAGANQTSASSQELSRLAMSFNSLVGKFKL